MSAVVEPTPPESAVTVPVLMYHDVAENSGGRDWAFAVPPALFDEHLSALAATGYHTAPFRDLSAPEHGPSKLTVYLTFDDGYVSYNDVVVPMLHRYGMTATVFVPTAYI